MNLYVKNNRFWFELENLTRLFFPNEKINVYKEFSEVKPPYVFSELSDKITVKVQINDFFAEDEAEIKNDDTLDELSTVSLLYKMLRDYSQISQPWGLLTGVRPVKLLRKISEESGIDSAVSRFTNDFFVSEQKAELARITEQNERKILSLSKPESFSLYVGIPFCPSRCSYC
jgi:oxygen-independent coproporphyrinogen-3 oxidase